MSLLVSINKFCTTDFKLSTVGPSTFSGLVLKAGRPTVDYISGPTVAYSTVLYTPWRYITTSYIYLHAHNDS